MAESVDAEDLKSDQRFSPQHENRGVAEKTPNDENAVVQCRPSSDGPGHSWGKNETPVDAVEAALADALTKAAGLGQWSTVEVLSRELEARRKARAQVVDLTLEKQRRGR